MLKHNTLNTRRFASNAQAIVPIILHHHYPHISDYSQHQIVINKSLSIAQPLIVPIERADHNCISLEELLVLLDERLLQEQTYINEITHFKDSFCGEFDQFCESVSDKKLLMFVRNQRQRIIDCVFDSLKFEKRQMIAKFYDNMMSGYDLEAMKEFEKIVCNVLWKPLLTPLPLGLTERIEDAVEEIKNGKSEKNIEEIASRMVLFVTEHFKNNEIKLSAFANATDLENILVKLSDARKTCSVDIDAIDEDKIKLIKEFKPRCIKSVSFVLNDNDFEMEKLGFVFNHLSCTTSINAGTIKKISKNFPRVLKSITQHFINTSNTELEIITKNFENLNSLRLLVFDLKDQKNAIGDAGMLSVAHLISQNKYLKALNLNLQNEGYKNSITDTGLIHLSHGISELHMLAHLELTIRGENMHGDGVNAISKSLRNMNKMKHLHLDF